MTRQAEKYFCGYPTDQLRTLPDATATREGVLTALDRLALQACEDDTVFLFHSEHCADGEDGD